MRQPTAAIMPFLLVALGFAPGEFGIAANAVQVPPPSSGSSSSQSEPLVVFVESKHCNVCAVVRPLLDHLEADYKDKVRFLRLDVTDAKARDESRKTAKSMQLGAFFAFYEDTYPCVGIFNSQNKCVKELYGANAKEKYTAQIDKALQGH
jgi:thiol-disulfide isomerase/thioredoxin